MFKRLSDENRFFFKIYISLKEFNFQHCFEITKNLTHEGILKVRFSPPEHQKHYEDRFILLECELSHNFTTLTFNQCPKCITQVSLVN